MKRVCSEKLQKILTPLQSLLGEREQDLWCIHRQENQLRMPIAINLGLKKRYQYLLKYQNRRRTFLYSHLWVRSRGVNSLMKTTALTTQRPRGPNGGEYQIVVIAIALKRK